MSAPPLRVLVVDDEPAVAGVHRGYVERLDGFVVVGSAHRGDDVLPAVRMTRPDLVLLDVHLPDRSGIEVLHDLRAQRLPVDVLAITAAREVETVRAAMAGGVVGYLVKPFPLATFAERLTDYAAHRERLRAAGEQASLEQDEVDRLLGVAVPGDQVPGGQVPTGRPALPKPLSARTMELVVAVLQRSEADDLSAAEVAAGCGLSRVSARRYLDHLERTGQAVVRPRYGRAGRPENGYRWQAPEAR